jgi:hypothetical protein
MNSISLHFSEEEIGRLQSLIGALDSFYDNYDDNGNPKQWSFVDVDDQRQIACEMAEIIRDKI